MGVTAKNAIPYPELAEPADVPADMKEMAERLDTFGFVPAGAMFMWPGAAAPAGFFLMQGQANIPAAQNPTLAAMFGSTGGMVNMPDLRDRMPIGASATRALLSQGGEAATLLTANQSGVPSHNHTININTTNASPVTGGFPYLILANGGVTSGVRDGTGSQRFPVATSPTTSFVHDDGAHAHTVNGTSAGNVVRDAVEAHNNMPPYLAINYIIRGG